MRLSQQREWHMITSSQHTEDDTEENFNKFVTSYFQKLRQQSYSCPNKTYIHSF